MTTNQIESLRESVRGNTGRVYSQGPFVGVEYKRDGGMASGNWLAVFDQDGKCVDSMVSHVNFAGQEITRQ